MFNKRLCLIIGVLFILLSLNVLAYNSYYYDDFEDGSINTNKWERYNEDWSWTESGGELKLSISGGSGDYDDDVYSVRSKTLNIQPLQRIYIDVSKLEVDQDAGIGHPLMFTDNNVSMYIGDNLKRVRVIGGSAHFTWNNHIIKLVEIENNEFLVFYDDVFQKSFTSSSDELAFECHIYRPYPSGGGGSSACYTDLGSVRVVEGNFTIFTKNAFTGDNINFFNVTINSSNGYNGFLNSSNGYVELPFPLNESVLYNFTISAEDFTSVNYIDINGSYDLVAELPIFSLNVTAWDSFNSLYVQAFNVSFDSLNSSHYVSASTNNGNIYVILRNETYDVSITSSAFDDSSAVIKVDGIETKKFNLFPKYLYEISLIDESDKSAFDIHNISGVRLYLNNYSVFDFQEENVTGVNYSTQEGETKFRVEFVYDDGVVVNRYIDGNLFDYKIPVCANKEGTSFYEQYIISSSSQPVFLKNTFSDCYIAADYTRFAYQDAYLLKAYSIDALYNLFVYDGSDLIILASVDGSVQSDINIDTLVFGLEDYNIGIYGDGLSIEKVDSTQIKIYYKNGNNDSISTNLVLKNVDTGSNFYNYSGFADPNEFTLYFDYTTLNYTNTSLFKAVVTINNGEESVIVRYFNLNGRTGVISVGLAIGIVIALLLSGFTIVSHKTTFSWFGLIMCVICLGILSFAVPNWKITFMIVMTCIMMVYTIIVMFQKNITQVA